METVKVEDKNNHRGWKIINKDDMTKDDKIFGEKKTTKKPKTEDGN